MIFFEILKNLFIGILIGLGIIVLVAIALIVYIEFFYQAPEDDYLSNDNSHYFEN